MSSLPDGGRGLDTAKRFADWVASAGLRWWQMLPVGPLPKPNHSPYSSLSSFRLGNYLDGEWDSLHTHCAERGVRLLGDLPIFVPMESEDVQERPDLFRLNSDGTPEVITGVPPDNFSPTGQRWDHPHYKWSAHQAEDFDWWVRRFEFHLELFDAIRVDHFIGFHHAWEIPAGSETAKAGEWGLAPGRKLLEAVIAKLGSPLPLIAEDLGHITPEIENLRDDFALPGMHIFQNGGKPHKEYTVSYSGTHDNDTLASWLEKTKASENCWQFLHRVFSSKSFLAIAPMQDYLELGTEARMNVPGTTTGNWNWKLDSNFLTGIHQEELAARLRSLSEETARA
ncbi:MAG: 4-alpha-glucanotransferase [Planctomycetota bacterium]|nr:4-alpha-glucanotransferase [Planctomycetota bacterium]MDP6940899.1 4-alpha-glucanotransferase [Planctomycetota bacterium]